MQTFKIVIEMFTQSLQNKKKFYQKMFKQLLLHIKLISEKQNHQAITFLILLQLSYCHLTIQEQRFLLNQQIIMEVSSIGSIYFCLQQLSKILNSKIIDFIQILFYQNTFLFMKSQNYQVILDENGDIQRAIIVISQENKFLVSPKQENKTLDFYLRLSLPSINIIGSIGSINEYLNDVSVLIDDKKIPITKTVPSKSDKINDPQQVTHRFSIDYLNLPFSFQNITIQFQYSIYSYINLQVSNSFFNWVLNQDLAFPTSRLIRYANFSSNLVPHFPKQFSNLDSAGNAMLKVNIIQNQYFSCNIRKIILPNVLQQEFRQTPNREDLMVQAVQKSTQKLILLQYSYNKSSGEINFNQRQGYLLNEGQDDLQINIFSFRNKLVLEDTIKVGFDCITEKSTFEKVIPIYQQKNRGIKQIHQVYNEAVQQQFQIQFSFQQTINEETYFYLTLPAGISFLTKNSTIINQEGFSYSSLIWQDYTILFNNCTFNSSQNISLIFQEVQLQEVNIGQSQISCFSENEFLFYSDSSTQYNSQIFQKEPEPITDLIVVQFEQFRGFIPTTPPVKEVQTAVPSNLVLSFSILSFTAKCAWVILELPLEFKIGRLMSPIIKMTDCNQKQYYVDLQSQDNTGQAFIYSKETQAIYISCLSLLQSAKASTGQGTSIPFSDMKCLNNTISITQVESSNQLQKTRQIFSIIADSNTIDIQDPPIWYNSRANITEFPQTYLFLKNQQKYHEGILIQQYFQPQEIALIPQSKYQNDVTNFNFTVNFPIFMIKDVHAIQISLPIIMMQENEDKIVCENDKYTYFMLSTNKIGQFLQAQVYIKIKQNIQSNYQIKCQIYSASLVYNQQLNSTNSTLQSDKVQIIVLSDNEIISETFSNVDIIGSAQQGDWIKLSELSPIVLSENYIGKRGIKYTFDLFEVNIPLFQDSLNRIVIIQLDDSLELDSNFTCLILNDIEEEFIQIDCYLLQSNQIYFNSKDIVLNKKWKLSVTGVKNPDLNIQTSNTISKNLTFVFQYAWQQNIGTLNQVIYVISSSTKQVILEYSCNYTCKGCTTKYSNCIQCSDQYPYKKKKSLEQNNFICLKQCAEEEAQINFECKECNQLAQGCQSCSPLDLSSCSSCKNGYLYEVNWKRCIEQSLMKNNQKRTLQQQQKYLNPIQQSKSSNQMEESILQNHFRIIKENSNSTETQDIKQESSKTSKVLDKMNETIEELKNGKVIFIYMICSSIFLCILVKLKQFVSQKFKININQDQVDSNNENNNNKNNNNAYHYNHTLDNEVGEQVYRFRFHSLMLFILSFAEIIQLPYVLFWGLGVSECNFTHPILQTLIGTIALSCISWIFDSYLLGCILIDKENTPRSSCVLNPLPSYMREGSFQFTIILTRGIFSLIPKSVSMILSNAFKIQGWFIYPYFQEEGRSQILLTNLRKTLSQQIKSNVTGITVFISLLTLEYPEIKQSYLFIYDIIIFNSIMALLCYLNIRTIDELSLIHIQMCIRDSSRIPRNKVELPFYL
uniref:MTAp n=1 Tax=Tetrahymena canadensis TaxID=5894 RepID=A0A513X5B6_TETCN|nr:MTAp [Tetrahymena canadensis]